jgi:hypothetical protein
MIDPTDTLLENWREGNEEYLPSPIGGEYGQQPVTDYESPRKLQPPIFKSWFVTLANPGDSFRAEAGSQPPEYWTVSGCTTTAGVEAMAWAADDRAGVPEIIISGTGNGKIPGIYGRLYIVNTGVGAIRVLIRAITGYDLGSNNY